MDGRDVYQPELVAHPDLINLDVGMRRDGVLQLGDGRYQHAVDVSTAGLYCLPVADMHDLIEHAGKKNVPEFDLRLAGFHQPV